MSDVTERITSYLSNGGLFKPELANHDAVRDLLIEARADLAAERERADEAERCMNLAYAQREQANNEANGVERDCAKLEIAHGQNMREIDRLRAELAAAQLAADLIAQQGADLCTKYIKERDAVAIRLENALNEGAQRRAERDALRADLAAYQKERDEEVVRLRAERDAERDRGNNWREVCQVQNERVEMLRALLRECRSGWYLNEELNARIDAALDNGGDRD